MYPIFRLMKEARRARRMPPLPLTGTHVSHHICWPWDLDPWIELNNGRTLTLYDLGRVPYGRRIGFEAALRKQGWGMTVAGNSLRYRRRVRAFDRVEMLTRCLGWDRRFFYIEQSMWKGGDCTSHMLLRSAVTSRNGIVPPAEVLAAMGHPEESPTLPDWVTAWIAADATRPWPPARPEDL
ncbi:acyl-CoA thioesterase [Plastorhodobacter daqingensis]|uniref:Acyl-CoA thioesterase n=1 Tax=Plastorhodobacter daqingensis TaxID=1387281 RepID=A0ABW2URM1_9RHOB